MKEGEAVPSLGGVLDEGWRLLGHASRSPGHPLRTPVVATAGDDGGARVVVLRGVDAVAGDLEFHTDARSPKASALRRSAAMTWVFYDASTGVQWRARGEGRLHVGDDVWRAAWERVPSASRANYGSDAAPGAALEAPLEAIDFRDVGPTHFMVVRCRVEWLDRLWLRPTGNLRAQWVRDGAGWRGQWVVP